MNQLKVTIDLDLRTAFHTTGNRRRLGVDKASALDAEGHPVIPATTIKGFLREKAELLLRSWGHRVCTGPDPANMCDGSAPCLVCRVFGNPHLVSPLRFADARLTVPDVSTVETAIRSGVAISRYRRAAYPQRLFFQETTPAGESRWYAECEGFFSTAHQARVAAALLLLAARWGTAIGGSKTRGLGWVKEIRMEAALDGVKISDEDLTRFWPTWKEGKDVAED